MNIEGVDTNILGRITTRDDATQVRKVKDLLQRRFSPESPALVSSVVLAELTWVLGFSYQYPSQQIAEFLKRLANTESFLLEDSASVINANEFFRESKANFPDCLILARNLSQKISPTHTFDRKAAKLVGFTLLK